MTRWRDFPYAWSFINPLQALLGASRHHFLLVNDVRNVDYERRLAERPHTTLITPGENLGVARGRNRLIEAAIERRSELVVSLDDDLLVPTDYIDRLIAHMAQLANDGHRVGLVGPAVLDYHESGVHEKQEQSVVEAGELIAFKDTAAVRSELRELWGDELPADVVYHMGIRQWEDHYLRPSGPRAGRLRSVARSVFGTGKSGETANGEVRRTASRSDVLNEAALPIRVDTVAGGVCAYSVDLVRDIGFLEEAFSPFGYEDAEFAIRAIRNGYDNFVLPSEILLHDLASRNKDRDRGVVLVGLGKARALITRTLAGDRGVPVWIAESLVNGLLQVGFSLESRATADGVSAAELAAGSIRYLAGFLAGAFRPLSSVEAKGDWTDVEGEHGPGELQTSSGRFRFERIVCRTATIDSENSTGPPAAVDLDVEGLAVGIGGSGPLSGLPPTLKGSAGITYTLDVAERRFELSRLVVDVPGLFELHLAGALVGVGPGHPAPEISVESIGLEYLALFVRDRGLVARVESTVAWGQGLVGDGVLSSLGPRGDSTAGEALRQWLSGVGGTFSFEWHPDAPVTVGSLDREAARGGSSPETTNWIVEFSRAEANSVHS